MNNLSILYNVFSALKKERTQLEASIFRDLEIALIKIYREDMYKNIRYLYAFEKEIGKSNLINEGLNILSKELVHNFSFTDEYKYSFIMSLFLKLFCRVNGVDNTTIECFIYLLLLTKEGRECLKEELNKVFKDTQYIIIDIPFDINSWEDPVIPIVYTVKKNLSVEEKTYYANKYYNKDLNTLFNDSRYEPIDLNRVHFRFIRQD